MKKIYLTALLAFVLAFALQPFGQAQSVNPVDFTGIWWDPSDITCWRYKFVVVENEIVIRAFCPGMAEEIFGWTTLSGRYFTGKTNTTPGPSGGSRYPGKIEGRISDDNKIVYMTWPHRDGPYKGKYVRE